MKFYCSQSAKTLDANEEIVVDRFIWVKVSNLSFFWDCNISKHFTLSQQISFDVKFTATKEKNS